MCLRLCVAHHKAPIVPGSSVIMFALRYGSSAAAAAVLRATGGAAVCPFVVPHAAMSSAHHRVGKAEGRATKAAAAARMRREMMSPTAKVVLPPGAENHPKIRAHREAL